MNRIARNTGLAAMALTLSLGMAACGSEDEPDATTDTASETTSETPSETPSEDPMEEEEPAASDAGAETFGAGCAAITELPDTDPGSFAGMATEPVATAASGNPLLKTLVAAVTEADLVDTLNSAPAITVFAPTDDAFAKIDAATMDTVMGDKELLTSILTNHVVEGQLGPDDVVGKQTSLAGGKLNIKGSGEEFTVKSKGTKMSAVLCGNIPTANATVYVVDTVLLP